MLFFAAEPAHPTPPPLGAIVLGALLVAAMLVPLALAARSAWRTRRAQSRRLERDRRRLARRLRRRAERRKVAECRAFVIALRTEIAGADDFLARTRPPAAPRRRSTPDQEGKAP